VKFGDRTLLRFLDPGELSALLPLAAGRALLDAAYEFDNLAVGDVSAVSARTVALAPALTPDMPLTVTARPIGGSQEWNVSGTWQPEPTTPVHAVLDVTVTAATRGVRTAVTEAQAEPLTGLRAEVEGAADFDAAVTLVAAHFAQTPKEALAEVLRRRGITDLDGLLATFGPTREPSLMVLTLVSDATGADIETPYLLSVLAQVVDDLAGGLLDAVAAVALARTGLDVLADPPAPPSGAKVRHSRPALMVFPESALDDADLPFVGGPSPTTDGQKRSSRLSELTTRLRFSGIVPVAI
jgi:hypothetical protein